jgi:hypothetical protein
MFRNVEFTQMFMVLKWQMHGFLDVKGEEDMK